MVILQRTKKRDDRRNEMTVTPGAVRPQRPSAFESDRQRSLRIRQFMTVFGAMHFADRVGRPEAAPGWRAQS
jgi:hypothetical protein